MAWRLFLAIICCLVQTDPAPLRFAVASVRLNTSTNNGIGNKFGPDSVRWTSAPLETLVEAAYHLKHYQVLGGPAWISSDRWDIDAKSDGQSTMAQKADMLGSRLADRFHLKFHRETRDLPVYRIDIAKGGSKLAAAKPQDPEHRYGMRVDRGLLDMRGADMQNLVFWLSTQLDQPIVDGTGLTGVYDLKLEWNQDEMVAGKPGDAPASNSDLPILSAMEVELGLKMVATKGPVEVLVIDHVERAAAN